ncbi:DUF788-domain-containing protein [Gonapodya prolifera JEL478]|uniref:DUF788-domain-containing protein n=1 Tax=Gonapodya prolifera (strain JEL478) TaxID=1344416 RepID=A0A139AS94_GONPJ|nr:DUF788-domain-containing protein [Gonapodya prolifera JEL478]|eukprot:KXS19626.1 DUF788-domain-containing protein [Gonapodya prolifera JEL478]
MARNSDKKLLVSNARTLRTILIGTLGSFLLHIAVLAWTLGNPWAAPWSHLSGLLVVNGLAGAVYLFLRGAAAPKFGQGGELVHAGEDLGAEGLTEYLLDLVYMAWIINVATAWSYRAWWLYLGVPAFAGWKVYSLVMGGSSMLSWQGAGAAAPKTAKGGKSAAGGNKRR